MKFPNLLWALAERHAPHYAFCSDVSISPSRFSRCLNGQFDFSFEETGRIASALRLPAEWLFARPAPPYQTSAPVSEGRPTASLKRKAPGRLNAT